MFSTTTIIVLAIGLFEVLIASFWVAILLKYYNKDFVKFQADNEIDISKVKFKYRNILEE